MTDLTVESRALAGTTEDACRGRRSRSKSSRPAAAAVVVTAVASGSTKATASATVLVDFSRWVLEADSAAADGALAAVVLVLLP